MPPPNTPHPAALIAQDHERLGQLLERLRGAIASGRAEEAQTLFLQLQVSEESHFATEEAIMTRHGYPDRQRHRDFHAGLLEALTTIARALLAEHPRHIETGVADYAAQTLNHIETADRRLLNYLGTAAADLPASR